MFRIKYGAFGIYLHAGYINAFTKPAHSIRSLLFMVGEMSMSLLSATSGERNASFQLRGEGPDELDGREINSVDSIRTTLPRFGQPARK